MNLLDLSLVLSAIFCYGGSFVYSVYYDVDYLFSYYAFFLTFFSSVYHFYEERKYFAEDFICCFFMKLHLVSNYVWFLSNNKFWLYTTLSEVLGYLIFYISYKSWNFKHKNIIYHISHNIWHLYTGYLMWHVIVYEPRTNIGLWNSLFMLFFVIAITNHTLKNKLLYSSVIYSTIYLWELSNIYNIFYLGITHIVLYYFSIYEKLFLK